MSCSVAARRRVGRGDQPELGLEVVGEREVEERVELIASFTHRRRDLGDRLADVLLVLGPGHRSRTG